MAYPLLTAPQGPTAAIPTSTSTTPATTLSTSTATSTSADGTNYQGLISSNVILKVGLSFIGVIGFIVLLGFFAKVWKARSNARKRGLPTPSIGDVFFSSFGSQAHAAWLSGGRSRFLTDADLLIFLERAREERERKEEAEKVSPKLWEYVVEEQNGKTGLDEENWQSDSQSMANGADDTQGHSNLPITLATPVSTPKPPRDPSNPKTSQPSLDIGTVSSSIAAFIIALPDPDDPKLRLRDALIPGGNASTIAVSGVQEEGDRVRRKEREAAWRERTDLPPICLGLLDLEIVHPPPQPTYPPEKAIDPESDFEQGQDKGGRGSRWRKGGKGKEQDRAKKKYVNDEIKKALEIRHFENTGGRGGFTGDRGYHG